MPARWGLDLEQRIASPRGDPDNTLTRAELEEKALRLADYAGGASADEMRKVIARVWRLHDEANLVDLMK